MEITKCCLAPSGWHLVCSAQQGDPAVCAAEPEWGGLFVFDLRKLSSRDEASSPTSPNGRNDSALVAAYRCGKSEATRTGIISMALMEADGKTMAMCATDGVVRAFDIGDVASGRVVQTLTPSFEFDVVAGIEPSGARACALATHGRHTFVSTTTPSLGAWQRHIAQPYGHNDFARSPPPPMELVARAWPLHESHEPFPKEVLVADPLLRPGESFAAVQAALEQDRLRLQRSGLL